jgi:hypothetical protein
MLSAGEGERLNPWRRLSLCRREKRCGEGKNGGLSIGPAIEAPRHVTRSSALDVDESPVEADDGLDGLTSLRRSHL